jgi:hypothetical protein
MKRPEGQESRYQADAGQRTDSQVADAAGDLDLVAVAGIRRAGRVERHHAARREAKLAGETNGIRS